MRNCPQQNSFQKHFSITHLKTAASIGKCYAKYYFFSNKSFIFSVHFFFPTTTSRDKEMKIIGSKKYLWKWFFCHFGMLKVRKKNCSTFSSSHFKRTRKSINFDLVTLRNLTRSYFKILDFSSDAATEMCNSFALNKNYLFKENNNNKSEEIKCQINVAPWNWTVTGFCVCFG